MTYFLFKTGSMMTSKKRRVMMKNKHITDSDRLIIEHGLKNGMSFREIATETGKHRSTISREILARRTPSSKGAFQNIENIGTDNISEKVLAVGL
jgi:IS30 family transposase